MKILYKINKPPGILPKGLFALLVITLNYKQPI
jgi:hypothetical protein